MTDELEPSDEVNTEVEELVPLASVVGALKVYPLEEGDIASEVFVLLKTAHADGEPGWSYRKSSGLTLEELLGALLVQVRLIESRLVQEFDES